MAVCRLRVAPSNNPRRKDKMNIERLAKRLKEFTLDDIEMLSGCDCKTELENRTPKEITQIKNELSPDIIRQIKREILGME